MSTAISTNDDLIQQQILSAAKRLFQVHGLTKVTMDDVAKAIGKGRSSLYYYYKSKEEIYDAVVMIEIQEMLSAVGKAVDAAASVEQKLHAFFLTKLEQVRGRMSFFRTIDVGMDAIAFSDFQKIKIVHHNLIMQHEGSLLKRLLAEAIKNGELKKISTSQLDMTVFVLLSSLRGLKRELELENDAKKLAPAVAMFTKIAMHGLAL